MFPHVVGGLHNSHHTQHPSASCLTPHEISLLTSHITLSRYNNFNPATHLPLLSDKTPHDCLTLTDQLLTLRADLQETLVANIEISWLTDGSCLKNSKGKYCTGYAIICSFEVTEAAPLLTATSAQQAELHGLTRDCTLAEGKTVNTYTDCRFAFRVVDDFGML